MTYLPAAPIIRCSHNAPPPRRPFAVKYHERPAYTLLAHLRNCHLILLSLSLPSRPDDVGVCDRPSMRSERHCTTKCIRSTPRDTLNVSCFDRLRAGDIYSSGYSVPCIGIGAQQHRPSCGAEAKSSFFARCPSGSHISVVSPPLALPFLANAAASHLQPRLCL